MKYAEIYEKEADEIGHLYFGKYEISKTQEHFAIPHFHESEEFIFVKSGKYLVHIGAEERTLCAGEIAFIDSFEPHSYRSIGDAVVYAVVIERKLFSVDPFETRVFAPFPQISAEDFGVFMKFFDAIEGHLYDNAYTKSGFADVLAGLLLRFIETKPRKENKSSRTVSEVLKYLNEHFREDVTLSSLAARFAYAENYFSSLFNVFTGMTLREYLNRRRIGEVLKLKAQTPSRSMSSIAAECGYTSEKTFFRAYAKYKNG